MRPSPATVACIFDHSLQNILLVKRKDVPVWVLPGGGKDVGESSEEAILREVKEETGLEVHIIRHAAKYIPINALASETDLFFCIATAGEPALSDETCEIAYFPLKELPKSLFPIHATWIEETQHNPNFIERKLYEITYTSLFIYFLCHPLKTLRYAWTRYVKTDKDD